MEDLINEFGLIEHGKNILERHVDVVDVKKKRFMDGMFVYFRITNGGLFGFDIIAGKNKVTGVFTI